MDGLHIVLLITIFVFIVLTIWFYRTRHQNIKKAEDNIFRLFMNGAYENRLSWFKVLNTQAKDKKNTVFIGDSLIEEYPIQEMFGRHDYLNRGIGGDTTEQLLKRLDRTLKGLHYHQVVLLIGTNDLSNNISPEKTINHIHQIVDRIKHLNQTTRVLILSVLPVTEEKMSHIDLKTVGVRTNQTIDIMNKALKKLEGAVFIDLNTKLKDQKGQLNPLYTREGLHLSPQGYQVITEALKNVL